MDAAVAASWVAVAGTLGGVVVGAGLDWIRSGRAERRAAAGRRDEAHAELVAACGRLQMEAATFRGLASTRIGLAEAAEWIRVHLTPAVSAVTVLVLRLALGGDEPLRAAAERVGEAALAFPLHIYEPDAAFEECRQELAGALGELWSARAVSAAHWWRRRRLRRAVEMPSGPSA